MYIVAFAWLYVTLLMAFAERSVVAGAATFVFYGVLPLALFLWLAGTPQRKRDRQRSMLEGNVQQPDGADTKGNQ
jgi:hypothetical protein